MEETDSQRTEGGNKHTEDRWRKQMEETDTPRIDGGNRWRKQTHRG